VSRYYREALKRKEVKQMTNLQKKIITSVAAGAILFNSLAGLAFADTTIEISGNGSYSDNDAKVKTTTTTTVVQNNDAKVSNDVDANASTGGNDANDNTGGDVIIKTGDADTNVDVSTTVNKNVADVNGCNCDNDVDVLISGNGYKSDNDVKLKVNNTVEVYQDNKAKVSNNIDADSKTGYNDANRNTGGDVVIWTGDATTTVDVSTMANANLAKIGGNGGGTDVDLRIVGNGSYSDNDIKLNLDQFILLAQNNKARIYNDIDANAKTGKNDANDNTGGDVLIDTGDADASVDVDNMVNFNAADVDCGCLSDVLAKISGNGSDSDNDIKARFEKDLDIFQDNYAKLKNDVDAKAKTGHNDAKRNTGDPDGDPAILTGDASSDTNVENSGNVNIFGPGADWNLDDLDLDLDFHFDLGFLLSLINHTG
jgi:hypothetical protein